MPEVFQSERFFREAWPQISHAFASAVDAATEVQWISSITGLEAGARVLDAPCGFGRHSIELGCLGYQVTGGDFRETELERAGKAAREAGLSLTLVCQDIRDMEFPPEFDLGVNLFSSIGYFSDDEDRLRCASSTRSIRRRAAGRPGGSGCGGRRPRPRKARRS
jgi:SAM-dependent methyltransferase